MVSRDDHGPRQSKASIKGHPIHPMLIPFPIALLFLLPVTDIVYAANGGIFWARVSYYLLWGGIVSGGLAAIVGLIDFVGIRRARSHRAGWLHLGANAAVLALAAVNLLLRIDDPASLIVPSGLILSVVGLALLLVGGWYGGELAYRHKIGVAADGQPPSVRAEGAGDPRRPPPLHEQTSSARH